MTNESLQASDLMAAARGDTGLQDFGHAQFIAGLERLIVSINGEARLTEIGMDAQRQRIAGLLVNRLRIKRALATCPEIRDETITAPLVIVGLPRTGSTMTHRLLASDTDHTAMRWWEGRHPAMLPGEVRGQSTARRELGRAEVDAVVAASPEAMDIHPWDFDGADEEILLVEHTFHSTVPEAYMHLPSYSAWVEAQDHVPVYQDLLACLQYLQWQDRTRAGKRWVLKSPHHLGYLDALLQVFPDARIIQTHRDPMQTVPSFCSMCVSLSAPLTRSLDANAIGRHWATKLARNLERSAAVASDNPQAFIDLYFRDMVKDPIGEMEACTHVSASRSVTRRAPRCRRIATMTTIRRTRTNTASPTTDSARRLSMGYSAAMWRGMACGSQPSVNSCRQSSSRKTSQGTISMPSTTRRIGSMQTSR